MEELRVLLTAAGCPGAAPVIRQLKQVDERSIEIIGTDIDQYKIGAHWCDRFHLVPKGGSSEFIPRLIEIIELERPHVLLPQSSAEIIAIASNKELLEAAGTKVMVASEKSVKISENKDELYSFFKDSPVKVPEFRHVSSLEQFVSSSEELGYPDNPVCFKPPFSKGSRGFRILSDDVSRKEIILKQRPFSYFISMNEFMDVFGKDDEFPELLVMEYVQGIDCTTDPLTKNGEVLLCPIKSRHNERCGLPMKFVQVESPELLESTSHIVKTLELDWIVNVQFIGEYLIELNPRISTQIFAPGLNIPYLAIKLLLEEITSDEVRDCSSKINIGQTSVRYYNQIFFDDN
ncbi:MAG: ATP-grasp domain-containing protein [Candidatus Poseidoniia archaeon]|nr:ATP-grasp domain-containing protein [Candidatus Poseidoniia archaeon]